MENLTPEQVVEKINTLFVEKTKGMATSDDLSAIKAELGKLANLESKSASIESAIAKFEGQLEAMKETAKVSTKTAPKTLKEAINMNIAEKHAELVETVIEKKGSFSLDVKTDTTITGDYTGTVALSTLEPGVNRIARPIRRIMEIANVGTTSSKFVTYIQQTVASTTAPVAEAVAKSNGQVSYQEVSVEVKKIAGFIKVSKEMLADLSFVQSEINNDLMEEVMKDIDQGILVGSGVGANLNGVYTVATAWAAGTFAGAVPNATIIDVLRVGKSQIEGANHNPTHIVLHPADVAAIELSKATGGEYTYPNFTSGMAPNMQLSGLIIVPSTHMTAGTFLIGDFTKFNVRVREGVNIQVGYEGDDFARNMVSILAEARLCSFVKANDTTAFVKGVVATCIAAL
jgi:HK97 family phage major capsid protein